MAKNKPDYEIERFFSPTGQSLQKLIENILKAKVRKISFESSCLLSSF